MKSSLDYLVRGFSVKIALHEIDRSIYQIADRVLSCNPQVMEVAINQMPLPKRSLKKRALDWIYAKSKCYIPNRYIDYGSAKAMEISSRPVKF